jgi:hypothetical protein
MQSTAAGQNWILPLLQGVEPLLAVVVVAGVSHSMTSVVISADSEQWS